MQVDHVWLPLVDGAPDQPARSRIPEVQDLAGPGVGHLAGEQLHLVAGGELCGRQSAEVDLGAAAVTRRAVVDVQNPEGTLRGKVGAQAGPLRFSRAEGVRSNSRMSSHSDQECT